MSDGALPSGEAEPQLPSVAAREPHISRWSHAAYSATDGTLPSGAAEPQLPSDAVRVPPSVAPLCFFSIGRGSPSGAADPRLPPVAVLRLRPSFRVALRTWWRTGLPLPAQQSRWLPSVVTGALLPTRQTAPRIKLERRTLPSGAAEPQLPSDAVRVPPPVTSLLLSQHRTGLPFRCSRPTAPFGRSVTPPSVISSCAARSAADGAPTPGAAEPLAPFGCNGSPSSDAPKPRLALN